MLTLVNILPSFNIVSPTFLEHCYSFFGKLKDDTEMLFGSQGKFFLIFGFFKK
jgi:hypothetical protein